MSSSDSSSDKSLADIIKERKYHRSSTPDEERKSCPECGSITISPRSGGTRAGSDAAYVCDKCNHYFDRPTTGGECR